MPSSGADRTGPAPRPAAAEALLSTPRPEPWAHCGTTSFGDTVLLCDQTHHDVHAGKTIRLKDGRRLNQHGWTDGPG